MHQQNVFPKQWKTTESHLFQKSGLQLQQVILNQSRPHLSCLKYQINQYIEEKAVYKSTQSGYRAGHSTITLLLKLRDDIQKLLKGTKLLSDFIFKT